MQFTFDGRPLMFARNQRGPTTVPFGTPKVIGAELEGQPFCFCQETSYPLKPCSSNTVVFKLDLKPLMRYLIKGFSKNR